MTEESFDELIAQSRDALDREEHHRQDALRVEAEAQRLLEQESANQAEAYARVAATLASDVARVYRAICNVPYDEWVIDREVGGRIARDVRGSPRLTAPLGSTNSLARQRRNARWVEKQIHTRQNPHVVGAWSMRFRGYLLTAGADVVNMHVATDLEPMGSTPDAPVYVEFISPGFEPRRDPVTEDDMRNIRIGLARLVNLHELP